MTEFMTLEQIEKMEEAKEKARRAKAENAGYFIGQISEYFIAPLLLIASGKILNNYLDGIIPILTYWQTFTVYFTFRYCFVNVKGIIKKIGG